MVEQGDDLDEMLWDIAGAGPRGPQPRGGKGRGNETAAAGGYGGPVLINKRITAARTSLHPATVMRKVREGAFPKPVPLGPARIAFVEAEVDAWIKARIEDRDAEAAE